MTTAANQAERPTPYERRRLEMMKLRRLLRLPSRRGVAELARVDAPIRTRPVDDDGTMDHSGHGTFDRAA
jgi:hypothetical protein